jgi:hypothetical protein
MTYASAVTETTSGPDLTVVLGAAAPVEPCANCGAVLASNRQLLVVPAGGDDGPAAAQAGVCLVCVEHYGEDGVAVRLWPDICDWIPLRIFEDCQCETCTGQIEFRISAGSDFYD